MIFVRRALADASEGRTKIIALEAFPDSSESTAKAELSKILSGERGESVLRVVDAVLKFGDRGKLRSYFDERLRDVDSRQIADRVEEIGEQLSLAFDAIGEVKALLVEHGEITPLKRKA